MVGRDEIAQIQKRTGVFDLCWSTGLFFHAVEIGRTTNIGGIGIPSERIARLFTERAPLLVALEQACARFIEGSFRAALSEQACDLFIVGPDITQEDFLAFCVRGDRGGFEVEVHRAHQRISDNERRSAKIVLGNIRRDTAIEVTIARKDAR